MDHCDFTDSCSKPMSSYSHAPSHRLWYSCPHIGTLSLLPNSPAQTVFSYVFLQPFQNIPQAALGIVSMSTPQQVSQNDNSFYVIPRATSTMIQVTSRLQTSNWFISRITFLASTSSELLLSTLSARTPTLIQLSAILAFRQTISMLYSNSQVPILSTYPTLPSYALISMDSALFFPWNFSTWEQQSSIKPKSTCR